MLRKLAVLAFACMLVTPLAFSGGQAEQEQSGAVYLRFYYPVGVAGDHARIMESMVRDFNASQSDIIVEPIFSGGYRETMERAQTAYLSGNAPEVAVLDAPAALDLIEMGAIVPLDDYIEAEGGDAYISNFLAGFMEIARLNDQTWSLPFQRSTPLFYYNRDHFEAAGLDPDNPPTTWDEVEEAAAAIAAHFGTDSTRWPIQVPINFWLLKPLVLQAGGEFESADGRSVAIDTPEMRDAFNYMLNLVDQGYMAPIRQWAPSVSDFIAGNVSMLYNSTGSLGHIERSADFEVGTAFLPMYRREVVIEGGGNFFVFDTDERRQQAAWDFIAWMTNAENAARWSIESGYVAVRADAYDLPVYVEHVANNPNSITAFRQLQSVDVERNFMAFQQAQLAELLNEMKEDILGGDDLDRTLVEAQRAADEILARFQ